MRRLLFALAAVALFTLGLLGAGRVAAEAKPRCGLPNKPPCPPTTTTAPTTTAPTTTVVEPPPPPPSGYPASFTTGPAGSNIILPADPNTAFLGVSPSADPTTQADAVEAWLGRKLAIRNHFDQGNCGFDTAEMEGFRLKGWIPMVSWNGGYTPAQVRDGNTAALACIDQWAQGARAWGHPFILRPWWEFNIGWSDGFYGNYYHSVGQEFIDGWRALVNRATAVFGTQATWVWATYEGYFKASMPDSYPGDAFVDVIANDAYNNGNNWCGPRFGWCSWAEVGYDSWSTTACENTYRCYAGRKAFMIAETGTVEGAAGQKGQWIRDLCTTVDTLMPHTKYFVYFNQVDGASDWRLNTSTSSQDGFRACGQMPRFGALP